MLNTINETIYVIHLYLSNKYSKNIINLMFQGYGNMLVIRNNFENVEK